MQNRSFARALLKLWEVPVVDIPTSDLEQKKEADFLATFGNHRILIEEKTKEDNPEYLLERAKKLDRGELYTETLPLIRNETISGILHTASKQLKSSSSLAHDFRIVWFTATGVYAEGKYEQFMATLYGWTNIIEMNSNGFRRCYYFRNADFFRRASIIDAAVAAYSTNGESVTARLCLNALSPRYQELKKSDILKHFGNAIEDPVKMESSGAAFILDTNLSRKDEAPLLEYLRNKYNTAPLMSLDLGYTHSSILASRDKSLHLGN